MTMKKKSTQLKWLETQMVKDRIELDKEKQELINQIKKMKREDVLPQKKEPEKLTIWEKIKKVLMGL